MDRRPDHAARADLVRELLEARCALEEASAALDRAGGDGGAFGRYEAAAGRLAEAERAYEAVLPRLRLSRCPLTGEVYRTAIDTGGLDGPWWDAETPVRPADPSFPTLFALGGAVDLGETVPDTPFLVLPGPGAPWVSPRLLRLPGVRAVVSQVEVGGRPAYPVAYFSEDAHRGVLRIATWGTMTAPAVDLHGEVAEVEVVPGLEEYDFELGPWLAEGRLLWIGPGDPSLRLHSSADGCPYLGLPGRREPVMLRRGKIRTIGPGPAGPNAEGT